LGNLLIGELIYWSIGELGNWRIGLLVNWPIEKILINFLHLVYLFLNMGIIYTYRKRRETK